MPGEEPTVFELRTLWVVLALAAAVFGAYAPITGNEFVLLDDDQYIFDNGYVAQGLTAESIDWAFTTFHAANWHPLTWLSHMLDVELFGLEPAGHHLMGVGLHALNATLLFVALRLLTGAFWPPVAVAALFALHPLRVESVAWAAERKDLLSGLLWMTTLILWAWYSRRPGPGRYLLVAGSMALGLMAKPMLVTLPLVLLVLDVWPLRRFSRSALIEKLPLFGLALASTWVTMLAQRQGGAVSTLDAVPPALRAANALVAYPAYLWKFVWPAGLAYFYPHPGLYLETPGWLYPAAAGSTLLLAAISFGVLRARSRPHLALGWLWYLVTLVPVCGLFQVGSQAMADRYSYIPLIGIGIAVVWAAAELVERRPALRPAVVAAACVIALALALASRGQVRTWKDSPTLFEHAVRVTGNNYVARTALGNVFNHRGELDQAVEQYDAALRVRPDYADAHSAMGIVFGKRNDMERAAYHFERAVAARPDHPDAHYNLGLALHARGRIDEAAAGFETAIRHRPDFMLAHYALGSVRARQGRDAEAREHFRRALTINPDHEPSRRALAQLGPEAP